MQHHAEPGLVDVQQSRCLSMLPCCMPSAGVHSQSLAGGHTRPMKPAASWPAHNSSSTIKSQQQGHYRRCAAVLQDAMRAAIHYGHASVLQGALLGQHARSSTAHLPLTLVSCHHPGCCTSKAPFHHHSLHGHPPSCQRLGSCSSPQPCFLHATYFTSSRWSCLLPSTK